MLKMIIASPEFVMTVKILLSLFCGGLLGFEREQKGRPAGFRTYILVSVGATLVMITNQYLYTIFPDIDPSRMGAQVISGIGFLGVGTIIVTGYKSVKGLTTAAGLWATACVGLAIGSGNYYAGVLVTLLMYVTMNFLKRMDKKVNKRSCRLNVYVVFEDIKKISIFVRRLKEIQIKINDLEIENPKEERITHVTVFFSLTMPKNHEHSEVLEKLENLDGVIYAEEISQ